MTLDEFWTLVERVHAAAPRDMKAKCQLLDQELRNLPLAEVLAFDRHFVECFCQAYHWDIWGAAYIIGGGCSDDGFMDFRSTLISLGRVPFEAALRDADSLADFEIDREWACYEGYQYVPAIVYRDRRKNEPEGDSSSSGRKYPSKPTGTPFDDGEMTPRFPRLVAKFKHKDVDPEIRRQNLEKQKAFEAMVERVRETILRGVIPVCGLIPHPRIVKQVLVTGKAPKSSGLNYEWEPFELDERAFWSALTRLQKASPDELKVRPDLEGRRIGLDSGASGINEYDHWIRSLQERGLQNDPA